MKLVEISYPESRLRFFEKQLVSANRRLKRGISCDLDPNELSDLGDIVSYYFWAVGKAKEEMTFEGMEDET